MKSVKKLVAVACTVALVSSLFAGCGSKDQSSKASGDSGKQVEISFWEQDDSTAQKTLDELIKEFQNKNPNIKVKRTHYETEDLRKNFISSAQGGNGPDIVLGPNDNLGTFVPGDLIQSTEDIMGEDFFKNLDPKALDAAKYNGKQYMIPDRNGNEILLTYNKKLMPEAPKTWEELEAMTKKLQAEKKVEYGVAFNTIEPFFSIPYLAAFGGKVFDDESSKSPKPTLNTAAVKDWMTFLKRIQDEKIIAKGVDGDAVDALFKDGKVAAVINGPWGFKVYQDANIDIGLAAIPSINGKDPQPYSAVKGYTISKSVTDASKKDAVKKFLEFVNTKDAQLKMVDAHQQLPTNLDAIKDSKITGNALISGQKVQLDKSIPMPIVPQMRAIWDAAKPVQQEVLSGKIKPADAPAEMQKKAEEGIKALGF